MLGKIIFFIVALFVVAEGHSIGLPTIPQDVYNDDHHHWHPTNLGPVVNTWPAGRIYPEPGWPVSKVPYIPDYPRVLTGEWPVVPNNNDWPIIRTIPTSAGWPDVSHHPTYNGWPEVKVNEWPGIDLNPIHSHPDVPRIAIN